MFSTPVVWLSHSEDSTILGLSYFPTLVVRLFHTPLYSLRIRYHASINDYKKYTYIEYAGYIAFEVLDITSPHSLKRSFNGISSSTRSGRV